MRVRSASCRFFRFSRFLLFVSIAPLPKTARQTDNSLALCLRGSSVAAMASRGSEAQPWALS